MIVVTFCSLGVAVAILIFFAVWTATGRPIGRCNTRFECFEHQFGKIGCRSW